MYRVGNQQENSAFGSADCLPSLFTIYDPIRKKNNVRIVKYKAREFEAHPMFHKVRSRLRVVPLKQSHSITA
jgi:hypothetical protein